MSEPKHRTSETAEAEKTSSSLDQAGQSPDQPAHNKRHSGEDAAATPDDPNVAEQQPS